MNFHDHPRYREMESEHLSILSFEGHTYRAVIQSAAMLLHKQFLGEIDLTVSEQAELFEMLTGTIQKYWGLFDELSEQRGNFSKTFRNEIKITDASGYTEILDFLLESPTPEQIIEFRPSEALQERMSALLEANRNGIMTPEERAELDEFMKIEHLMRMLKARAHLKLSKL